MRGTVYIVANVFLGTMPVAAYNYTSITHPQCTIGLTTARMFTKCFDVIRTVVKMIKCIGVMNTVACAGRVVRGYIPHPNGLFSL